MWGGAPPKAPQPPGSGRPAACGRGCPSCSMMRVGCLLPKKEIPAFCKVLRRPPLPPSLTSQGAGACIRLALPLTVGPASSTLIYGAIWCPVIAHQYPIHHPACHGLWLLFHEAEAFEKEPATRNTGRGHRKCHASPFLAPGLLLTAGLFHEQGRGPLRVPGQGLQRDFRGQEASLLPQPYSPTPILSRCSSVLGIKQKSAYSVGH